MPDMLRAALLFLVSTIFDLYLFILVIRLILAWVESDYYNPVTQFVVKFTSFIVKPLKRFIPDYHGLELATIFLIIVIEIIKFLFISFLSFGFPNPFGLLIISIVDAIKLTIEIFFYAILFQAILSWIQPGSSISRDLDRFTSPILRPLQRVIPPVAGYDIAPIPALIILQLLIMILIKPLMAVGLSVAFA